MPKFINQQLILYFFLFLLSILIFSISVVKQSSDQANRSFGLASPRPTLSQKTKIDIVVPPHGNFSLPPPGILPSHPLYLLKMAKDRLILVFTKDPDEYARTLLLYSNIRMSAANELAEYGETDLSVTTAIKGQTYFLQAIAASPRMTPSLQAEWYELLKQTTLKHEEVIERIRFIAKDDRRNQAQRLWDQLSDFRQQLSNLSGIPFSYPRPEDDLSN